MSDPSPAPTPPLSASDSSARMARYKEERRRQLASQFSSLAAPVAEVACPSPRRYIARPRADDSPIKTTRTSRLRAGVEPAKSPSPRGVATRGSPRDGSSSSPTAAASPRRPAVGRRKTSKDGVSPARSADSVGSAGVRKASREESPRQEAKRKVSATGRGSVTSDRENVAASTPKDKSSKRMSSLNIGLAHEPTPPADYEQDASVRRRGRRGDAPPSEMAAKEAAKEACAMEATTRSSPRKEPVAVARRASSKEIVLTRRAASKEPSPPAETPPTRRTPSREQLLARKTSAKELVAPRAVVGRPKEPSPSKETASPRKLSTKESSPPKDVSSPRRLSAKESSPAKEPPSPRRLVAKEPSPPKDPSSPRKLSAKDPSPPKDLASPRRLVAKEPSPPKEPASPRRLVAKEPSPPKEPSSPRRLVAKEPSPPKEPSSPRRLVAKEASPSNEPSSLRGPLPKEPTSPRRLVAVELSLPARGPPSPRSVVAKDPSPPTEVSVAAKSTSAIRTNRVSPSKELPTRVEPRASPSGPDELRVKPKETRVDPKTVRVELIESRVEPNETRVSKEAAKSTKTTERPSQIENASTHRDPPAIVDRVTSPTTLPPDGDPTTASSSPRLDPPGPVSILKRKTSRDDAAHHPVTFACPEPEQRTHPRHGGILKKHSSLDEAEAARRRSCSPQGVDTKPILKRRSSLEDLVRRAASPESILKRRDDEDDVAATTGILKRKVSGEATSEGETEGEPRPILKKTSSEEYATAAESSSDSAATTPRPILKLRGEEAGVKVNKTILKPARKNSADERTERRDRRDSEGRYVDEGRYLTHRDTDADAGRRSASPDVAAPDDEEEAVVAVSVADRIRRMESALRGAVPKRRDNERYKTQPVTRNDFHGLSHSSELTTPTSTSSQHRSQEAMSAKSSPTSSDAPATATPRVFESMAEHVRAMAEEAKARRRDRTASRGVQRHRGGVDQDAKERHQTQPVTLGELQLAGKMNAEKGDEVDAAMLATRQESRSLPPLNDQSLGSSPPQTPSSFLHHFTHLSENLTLNSLKACKEKNRAVAPTQTPRLTATLHVASDENEDAASRLSLAERVRLFDRKAAEASATPPPTTPSPRATRGARFKTQPVTLGELGRLGVGVVSPLAAAFVRHPDTDKIAAMPARAARAAMFEHGQSALRSILKPGVCAAPAAQHDDAVGAETHKSILKSESAGFAPAASSDEDDDGDGEPDEGSALTTMLNDVASRGKLNGHGEGGVGLAAELERKLASRRLVEEFNASRKVNGRTSSTAGKEVGDETAALQTGDDESKSDDQDEDRVKSSAKNNEEEEEEEVQEKTSSRKDDDDELKSKSTSISARDQENDVEVEGGGVDDAPSKQPRVEALRGLGVARVAGQGEATSSAADTGSDGDSSGGREVKRIIRNEAVARRRQAALAVKHRNGSGTEDSVVSALNTAIAKSKSHSALGQHPLVGAHPSGDQAKPRGRPGGGAMDLFSAGLKRSQTQPMEVTHDDIKETSSIAERLAALKKSQDTGWQKRLPKLKAEDDLAVVSTNNLLNSLPHPVAAMLWFLLPSAGVLWWACLHLVLAPLTVYLLLKLVCARGADPLITASTPQSTPTPTGADSVVADRRGKLDVAAQGWKKRVEPSDAVGFSVAGRMRDVETVASPVVAAAVVGERMKRTPRPNRFRSKASEATASTPVSPLKELTAHARFVRSASAPDDAAAAPAHDEAPRTLVEVPRADNETFTMFYSSFTAITTCEQVQTSETLESADFDLDAVRRGERTLSVQTRRVRAHTRRHAASRNPLRALAARTDLCSEYVEELTGLADRELRRLQVEKLAKGSNLALEALAGLASKEDFSAVALRKGSPLAQGAMLPHRDLMLLHVKGRRRVQTRLVEPSAASVNSGDSYVLVTPTEVYNWLGLYSNVIERSRSAEIAALVQQRKDLNCSASAVVTITEGKSTASAAKTAAFWTLLGAAKPSPAPAGHPDEDEAYETGVVNTNMVYAVSGRELVPCDEYWGATPRIEMLDPAKVLVFDFGAECYVWCGKTASMADRRAGTQLATELWREGFDYAECDVCPVTAAKEMGSRGQAVAADKVGERPTWALLAKVTQHMETVLFREKFLDWPDFSRVIRGGPESEPGTAVDGIDVKPCDAAEMWSRRLPEPDLQLEGSHLGRGVFYHDEETRRTFAVSTASVTVWHVDEFERWQLPSGASQLHAGDSFVVRWLYSVTATARELSGAPSKHAAPGRDRCAYFTWQGGAASLNEQGAAALMTVELDSERGTQTRVAQGTEPPAFLRLFGGRLVVHQGRRNESRKVGGWRLYLVRGECESEATLVEVSCSMRQLRSRGCAILSHPSTARLFVWLGARSEEHARDVARAAAQRLREEPPPEAGFKDGAIVTVAEVVEGAEMNDFYEGMGGSNRQLYHSLLDCADPPTGTPRLFHLASVGDALQATEVGGPYRRGDVVNAFPFTQDDLYAASQPALFMLDAGDRLWLWQGWWPELDGLEAWDSADGRGTARVRWQAERRAAMATALAYWRASRPSNVAPRAAIVCAGLEPLAFVNAFVAWTDRDDAAAANMADGRKPAEALRVEDELARLTTTTFPAATLLQRPLPDGVDPTRLELYLDPLHFPDLLHMSKEEFDDLPAWKQTKVKKDAGLF